MKNYNRFTQHKFPILATTIFIIILSLLIAQFAMGRPFRLAKLPDRGRNFGCGTCHKNPRGGGARNPFGKDYVSIGMAAGDKYTDELANKDSDGDGFTNTEEFSANPATHPGDPKSFPKKAAVSTEKKSQAKIYVTNSLSNTVSVIDAASRKVVTTVSVGEHPTYLRERPDGKQVWVVNSGSNTVSVIET
nr:YncE family protein [Deltaproteobacteria bacterium]